MLTAGRNRTVATTVLRNGEGGKRNHFPPFFNRVSSSPTPPPFCFFFETFLERVKGRERERE